ncbi:MAG: hypothetical protein Tsb002_29080 [Wenzhouxiangellaceae bacterium]
MTVEQSPLASTLASLRKPEDASRTHHRLDLPADWMQGRALFGGLLAALAVQGLRGQGIDAPLRSSMVQFIGPAQAEGLELTTRVLRAGRSVTHACAELHHGEQVQTLVNLAFGPDREGRVMPAQEPLPTVPPPDECWLFPYIEGRTPQFTQYFEMCFSKGGKPFSSSDERELSGWLRLRRTGGVDGDSLALMLFDTFPSPMLPCMPSPAPISSVTWNAQWLCDPRESPADGWWYYQSLLRQNDGGFAHDDRRLWDPAGRLVAMGSQAVAVFT